MDSDQININEKLQEDTYSDEAQTRVQFNVEEDEGNKPLTILEEPEAEQTVEQTAEPEASAGCQCGDN